MSTYASVECLRALKNKDFTFGNVLGPTTSITDPAEAAAYLEAYVEEQVRRFPLDQRTGEPMSAETFRPIALSNIGYWTGYVDADIAARTMQVFRTAHPIFGGQRPSAQEAKAIGGKRGKRSAKD